MNASVVDLLSDRCVLGLRASQENYLGTYMSGSVPRYCHRVYWVNSCPKTALALLRAMKVLDPLVARLTGLTFGPHGPNVAMLPKLSPNSAVR